MHEVQVGPHELLEFAWNATVDSIFDSVIEPIPRHEAVLLTIGAIWDFDLEDEMQPTAALIAPYLIREKLRRAVNQLAAARQMSRFDPTMNG